MSSFTEPYDIRVYNKPIKDRPFELINGFEFYSKYFDEPLYIYDGYRTNFADVPRLFWSIVPPYGRYGKASIVHDWLIEYNPYDLSIHEINKIFLEAMGVLKVKWFNKYLIFMAVELYGLIGYPIRSYFKKHFS